MLPTVEAPFLSWLVEVEGRGGGEGKGEGGWWKKDGGRPEVLISTLALLNFLSGGTTEPHYRRSAHRVDLNDNYDRVGKKKHSSRRGKG